MGSLWVRWSLPSWLDENSTRRRSVFADVLTNNQQVRQFNSTLWSAKHNLGVAMAENPKDASDGYALW